MADDGTQRVHRGAADPVYLHFSSFLQMSVHRACTHLLDGYKDKDAGNDVDDDVNAEQYSMLVQNELERCGVDKSLAETFQPYQPYHFSATLLDVAHRSVVNATSRARSTNDAEYGRLRKCALDKQSKKSLKRPKTAASAPAPLTASGPLAVALSAPSQGAKLTPSEWPAFLRSLEEIAPVPSMDDSWKTTTLTEIDASVLRYQHRCMLRRVHQYKAVLDRLGLEPQRTVNATITPVSVPVEPQLEETKPPRKKQATSVGKWQYCEICAEQPRKKKEVVIRRCGHAMCKACLSRLKRVRDLHCPTCRISFSVPGDIQLLAKCTMSDLR